MSVKLARMKAFRLFAMPELRGVHALAFRILTDGGTLLWQKYLERKAQLQSEDR